MIDKVFEYGATDQPEAGTSAEHRQGQVVTMTYMGITEVTIPAHERPPHRGLPGHAAMAAPVLCRDARFRAEMLQ